MDWPGERTSLGVPYFQNYVGMCYLVQVVKRVGPDLLCYSSWVLTSMQEYLLRRRFVLTNDQSRKAVSVFEDLFWYQGLSRVHVHTHLCRNMYVSKMLRWQHIPGFCVIRPRVPRLCGFLEYGEVKQ